MNQFPNKNYFTMPNEIFRLGWMQVRSRCMPTSDVSKAAAPINAGRAISAELLYAVSSSTVINLSQTLTRNSVLHFGQYSKCRIKIADYYSLLNARTMFLRAVSIRFHAPVSTKQRPLPSFCAAS